jgi:putative transposase
MYIYGNFFLDCPRNMKANTLKPDRKSTRLPGYDYSLPGAYFITLVTYRREYLFGNVVEAQMLISQYGQIVVDAWMDLPSHYSNINLGMLVVMPNHVHGIVIITQDDDIFRGGPKVIPSDGFSLERSRYGLPEIVRGFKSFSARQINNFRNLRGNPVWQRSYYDRIIRNERELYGFEEYIQANPRNWTEDQLRKSNIDA